MPNGTTTSPLTSVADAEAQKQREILTRLMSRIAQPRSVIGPSAGAQTQVPKPVAPMEGFATRKDEGAQLFVHNLFGAIHNAAAAHKQAELNYATGILDHTNTLWERAQDLSNGDPKKAEENFKSLMTTVGPLNPSQQRPALGGERGEAAIGRIGVQPQPFGGADIG